LLWQRGYRAEVGASAFVIAAYLIAESSYYAPYGGDSPGPRYFIPALPFLAVGLAPAFTSRRILAAVLTVVSVVASTALALTWPEAVNSSTGYRWSVWREIGSLVAHGSSSELARWTQNNVLTWVGLGRLDAAAVVLVAALTAVTVSLRDGRAGVADRPRGLATTAPAALTALTAKSVGL
jgi:hypothetical protein